MRPRNPHPLIAVTRNRQSGTTQQCMMIPNDPTGADIRVSDELFDRALTIMNLLIRGLERQGFSARIVSGYRHNEKKTVAVRGDDRWEYELRVREKCRRAPHVLTEEEQEDVRKWGRSWMAPNWDIAPIGCLAMVAGNDTWVDGEPLPLEECISDAIGKLVQHSDERAKRIQAEVEEKRITDERNAMVQRIRQQIEDMGIIAYLYRNLSEADVRRLQTTHDASGFYERLYRSMTGDELAS